MMKKNTAKIGKLVKRWGSAAILLIAVIGIFSVADAASKRRPVANAVLSGGTLSCPIGTFPTFYLTRTNSSTSIYNPDGSLASTLNGAINGVVAIGANNNSDLITGSNIPVVGYGNHDGILQVYNDGNPVCSGGGAADYTTSGNATVYPLIGTAADNNGVAYQFDAGGRVFKGTLANCAVRYGTYTNEPAFIATGFNSPVDMTANTTAVFVLRNVQGVVAKYNSSTGALITSFGGGRTNAVGITADENGNVYTTDTSGVVFGYNASGTLVTTFGGGQSNVIGIANDGNTNVYVTDNIGTTKEYTGDGIFVMTFGGDALQPAVTAVAAGCRATQ